MEEYNADFSPAKLDWILRIAASGKVNDFAHFLELECAAISESKRLAFLEREQFKALDDPDFISHLQQKDFRQEHLKFFADNENTWQSYHNISTIEAFLSRFPFLQSIVKEMIAAEKVDVIKRAIEGLEQRSGEASAKVEKRANLRQLENCFKDGCFQKWLVGCESVTIVKDGETWEYINEGEKSHRVRAMWAAAIDAGFIKDKLKNNESTSDAIKRYFRMESLSKTTLDEPDPYNEIFTRTKAAIEKRLKNSRT